MNPFRFLADARRRIDEALGRLQDSAEGRNRAADKVVEAKDRERRETQDLKEMVRRVVKRVNQDGHS